MKDLLKDSKQKDNVLNIDISITMEIPSEENDLSNIIETLENFLNTLEDL